MNILSKALTRPCRTKLISFLSPSPDQVKEFNEEWQRVLSQQSLIIYPINSNITFITHEDR